MAVLQMGNCEQSTPLLSDAEIDFIGYFLLGLISSLVFRAVRDTLPNNPMAQERILGASFLALGIADVCSHF